MVFSNEKIPPVLNKILEEIMMIVKDRERKDSMIYSTSQILWLKPTFFGIGVDLNALIRRLSDTSRSQKKGKPKDRGITD